MTRESSVEVTQNLRKNLREKFAKFRKSGTPRAQKLRALSQRALKILHTLAEGGDAFKISQKRCEKIDS